MDKDFDKINKELPTEREKFSFLTHQLFCDISQVITKYMENFNEKNVKVFMPHIIAINALSRMISAIIFNTPKKTQPTNKRLLNVSRN
jgi:hypothetical protein